MREAIGGAWLMGVVVFFIVLFSSYLALSVNHSRAFNVKNAIVEIIERHGGYTACARNEICCYLRSVGYATGGHCNIDRGAGDYGGDWEPGSIEFGGTARRPAYCIRRHDMNPADIFIEHRQAYFSIAVFFRVDLPIFHNLFTFPIFGETMTINHPRDRDWPHHGRCPELPAHLHHIPGCGPGVQMGCN